MQAWITELWSQRHPKVNRTRKRKPCRHHPDNRHGLTIYADGPIHDVSPAAKTILPKTIGNNSYTRSSGSVLFIYEEATDDRLDLKRSEGACRHNGALDSLWIAITG